MSNAEEDMFGLGRTLIPTQYVSRPSVLGRVFHRSSLSGKSLAFNGGVGLVGGGLVALASTLAVESAVIPFGVFIPGIPLLFGMAAGLMPLTYGITSWWRTGYNDRWAMKTFSKTANDAIIEAYLPMEDQERYAEIHNGSDPIRTNRKTGEELDRRTNQPRKAMRVALGDDSEGERKEARTMRSAACGLVNSTDRTSEPVRRRTIMRIAAVQTAYLKSRSKLGTASTNDAVLIRNHAVRAIAEEGVRERQAVLDQKREDDARGAGGAIEDLRKEVSSLLSIGAPKAKMLPMRSGTGRAHIDRLIAKAEEALEIDPDMMDRSGARVDGAVHEHLPRLLQKHADMAKHARVEDLTDTDRMLDEGVEMIRLSIEEGLEGLRHDKADALRTEIGFLRLRRQGLDGPLNPHRAGESN